MHVEVLHPGPCGLAAVVVVLEHLLSLLDVPFGRSVVLLPVSQSMRIILYIGVLVGVDVVREFGGVDDETAGKVVVAGAEELPHLLIRLLLPQLVDLFLSVGSVGRVGLIGVIDRPDLGASRDVFGRIEAPPSKLAFLPLCLDQKRHDSNKNKDLIDKYHQLF